MYFIFVPLTPTLSHKGRGSFWMETIWTPVFTGVTPFYETIILYPKAHLPLFVTRERGKAVISFT